MSNPHSPPPLSPAEQAIMDMIWKLEPVAVTDLLSAVNECRPEPIIRNTLQTQLTRLEAKGWIHRKESGSARVYQAAIAERPGRLRVISDLKHRFFGGSGATLVRCLMEDGGLNPEEIEELNQLIRKHGKGGGK
jgi:BlaI family transcriptional regulator, penicillinase repressor